MIDGMYEKVKDDIFNEWERKGDGWLNECMRKRRWNMIDGMYEKVKDDR